MSSHTPLGPTLYISSSFVTCIFDLWVTLGQMAAILVWKTLHLVFRTHTQNWMESYCLGHLHDPWYLKLLRKTPIWHRQYSCLGFRKCLHFNVLVHRLLSSDHTLYSLIDIWIGPVYNIAHSRMHLTSLKSKWMSLMYTVIGSSGLYHFQNIRDLPWISFLPFWNKPWLVWQNIYQEWHIFRVYWNIPLSQVNRVWCIIIFCNNYPLN